MKFSKSWLQNYIKESLPDDQIIVDILNKKAFEVEEVLKLSNDTIFDIKVLPNRAHDALGHRGMAKELCACFGFSFAEDKNLNKDVSYLDSSIKVPDIFIEDSNSCTRFMGVRIDGVKVGESPAWLKEKMEAIGQRSINNIVDITNYVQFSINKPMHAYDSRSIKGKLSARFAKNGENLTTLDDKEINLDDKTLVIADDEKVLGLAGIKGGKYSGVKDDTTSVVLESANFEPTLIRKTAQKYDIRTDASKRFENGIANSLVEEGLYITANLIKEICVDSKSSDIVDVYNVLEQDYIFNVNIKDINEILGTNYDDSLIKETLNKLSFYYESEKSGEYKIKAPKERLDIRIKEDIAEEIGRIVGYDKLIPILPNLNRFGLPHKRMFFENKIREILIKNGFSEVMTYIFGNIGEVELVKGLAFDKEKLRDNLGDGISKSLALNLYNAPLLGEKIIKIFEFGNVFFKEEEKRHLSIAIDDGAKKSNFKENVSVVLEEIKKVLSIKNIDYKIVSEKPYIIEIDFDTMIVSLDDPIKYEAHSFASLPVVTYKSVSSYPFISRDIAMWVPDNTTWESVLNLCNQVHNTLVTRIDLFDNFSKEIEGVKKISFAFRLVFQSYEKTLTNDEVNEMVEEYYKVFRQKGYEIR